MLGGTVLKSKEHALEHNVAAFWIKARNKFQNHLQSLPFYLRPATAKSLFTIWPESKKSERAQTCYGF
jgi:hypothetical protein